MPVQAGEAGRWSRSTGLFSHEKMFARVEPAKRSIRTREKIKQVASSRHTHHTARSSFTPRTECTTHASTTHRIHIHSHRAPSARLTRARRTASAFINTAHREHDAREHDTPHPPH